MDYLLVNPFSEGTSRGEPSGVDAYVRAAQRHLPSGVTGHVLGNDRQLSRHDFQQQVREHVSRLDPGRWVIEAPEARAATLLVPSEYRTHVRLHCPGALAQFHDEVPIDRALLDEELTAVRRARVVSAPSNALEREVAASVPGLEIAVYPHPPPRLEPFTCERDIDALFLGRSQRLKGVDMLPAILRALPRGFRVVLAGPGLSEIPLGRGIRCHVDRLSVVIGPQRDALLHRARVVMLPSRFESFSMVLAEAFSARATVVAWCSGAPAEVAPPPLVRVVCRGDTDSFAKAVVEGARAPSVLPPRFDEILAGWAGGFEAGVDWAVKRSAGHPSSTPTPTNYRSAHRLGSPPEPALHRIARGEMRVPPIKPSSLQRKLQKLRRDPHAFFRDSRIEPLRRWLGGGADATPQSERPVAPARSAPTSTVSRKWAASSEPRYLGSVRVVDGRVVLERLDKKIAEPHLATILFSPASSLPFGARPAVAQFLADKSFVGFRDRYLFVMEHDLGSGFTEPSDLASLIDACPGWGQRLTRGVRNVVFVHPSNVLPYAIRATDHDVRLVVCASEETPRLRLLEQLGSSIDVLVAPESLDERYQIRARRRVFVDERAGFSAAVRALVMEHRDPEKNMLIPAFGEPGFIEDIDTLNARDLDGVIWLSEPCACDGRTFSDLLREMSERARVVLLRESRWLQYRDQCERGDVARLLQLSLEDGCRYEIRT